MSRPSWSSPPQPTVSEPVTSTDPLEGTTGTALIAAMPGSAEPFSLYPPAGGASVVVVVVAGTSLETAPAALGKANVTRPTPAAPRRAARRVNASEVRDRLMTR